MPVVFFGAVQDGSMPQLSHHSAGPRCDTRHVRVRDSGQTSSASMSYQLEQSSLRVFGRC